MGDTTQTRLYRSKIMFKDNPFFTKDFDRFYVGIDEIAKKLNSAASQAQTVAAKYPPYNLKKIDENKYTIELAVAGFAKQDLEIEIVDDKLIIKGNTHAGEPAEQDSKGEWTWPQMLHHGLAMRPFTRTFTIADNVEIRGASLLNGILKIALEAIIPEHKKPKKVKIEDEDTEYPSQAAEFLAEGKTK
jgi:molecular chaperone IbpA